MDKKEQILNAALKLFIKDGFHGTSTLKIAKEANVSNGTLFHHFKTKESLINSLYLRTKKIFKEYLLEHIDSNKTTKNKIKELWFNYAKWALEHRDSLTFLLMFSNSPYIDNLSKEEGFQNFIFIFELFDDAIKENVIMDINTSLITNYLFASVQAFINFIDNYPDKQEEYLDISFKMFWKSIEYVD